MEFDSVEQRIVMDWASVSGPAAQGFSVGFAGAAQIRLVDHGERNLLDRVDLDLERARFGGSTPGGVGVSHLATSS